MKQRKRAIAAVALAVALFAAAPAGATQKQAANGATGTHTVHKHAVVPRHAFDGLWSVSVFTQSGPCDASYRYPARIVRSQVLQADEDLSYQLVGAVAGNGMIVVTVSKGGQSATGHGRLHALSGSGQWSTADGQCSGNWTAVRRRMAS